MPLNYASAPTMRAALHWLVTHDATEDDDREPCGRHSPTCSRPDDCRSCHPWERTPQEEGRP